MADHVEDDDNDGNVFVYRGGLAPQHVTHVIIDKSVDEIEDGAFYDCQRLVKVETHDGIRKIGERAFLYCKSLPQINLQSVSEICSEAFYSCENLVDVEFGDELETIGKYAFRNCTSLSLEHLKLPSIISIGKYAFCRCTRLIDVELSERLETIGPGAFRECRNLQRIAIPLKRDLFVIEGYLRNNQFDGCDALATVDLVGGFHKTVASLHMESWRTVMIAKINRINQILPNTPANHKTGVIRQWMESVLDKIDNYKTEHCRYVKEGIALLELALWKAKLVENEDENNSEEGRTRTKKKAKVDAESARERRRITCGADIVIKNVHPFLQLE